jgi:hypothetical protein
MYSVVMVVAMAGAPEAPSCCCWKDFCCKSNQSSGCCDKNYGCANAPAPVAPAPPPPPPMKVAPAPVAVAPAQDCGSSKGCCGDCCLFSCFRGCCAKIKGCFSCCDKGYSSGCGGGCCDKGYSSGCGGGCCNKGYSSGCEGAVVPPPPPPVKGMPKVEKPKVGG